uniref:C-type lectin domain-containing protein n=1 Tax=Poecilia latipinna TaxID=48699 RepID=A0A3B3UJZ2_9TELE
MRTILVVVSLMSVLHFACGQHLGLREGKFTFYEIQKPWSEAQASCREHHTDLITIRTETDIQVLNGTRGWIGLHRDNNTSDWKWSRRNETATFLNWDENGERDEFSYSSGQGWIGLYRESDDGPWKWSSGDEIATFFKWELNDSASKSYARALWCCRGKAQLMY